MILLKGDCVKPDTTFLVKLEAWLANVATLTKQTSVGHLNEFHIAFSFCMGVTFYMLTFLQHLSYINL